MLPGIAILAVALVLCVYRIKLAGDEVNALFRMLDVASRDTQHRSLKDT